MCLLSFYPPGVMPVREHLEAGAQLNPHGFGFAVGHGYRHSMDPEWAIRTFSQLRPVRPDLPAMFHSRHATGDSPRNLDGCHPFRTPGGLLVAHNGYLFPHEGEQSDTAIFASEILPRYDLDDPADIALLEERMGPNKAVIFMAMPSAVILNKHMGVTLEDGTWHSNTDYLGTSGKVPGECIYSAHKTRPCGNPGEIPLGENLICRDCDRKARSRRALLMEGT